MQKQEIEIFFGDSFEPFQNTVEAKPSEIIKG